jgi:hypothetical protein
MVGGLLLAVAAAPASPQDLFLEKLRLDPPHITTDKSVRYDYDIVYVRARRAGDKIHKRYYTEIGTPFYLEPGADLMLLHPDGREELLVAGGQGAITDPMVSFDGEWIYYTRIYRLLPNRLAPPDGADIFKIHVKTRKIVRLTNQVFTPNTGVGHWSRDFRDTRGGKNAFAYGVCNFGPCPVPGGKLVFTSNRDGFRPPRGYPPIASQLFVMDDRDESVSPTDPYPNNIEKIGHLNIAGALHPVVLKDGRIIFSSLESQGLRGDISWGIWSILPDGTNWNPVVSAFDPSAPPNAFHFQAQLSDESIVIEEYYNLNNSGFGTYFKIPPGPPAGYPAFGPGFMDDPRNRPLRVGRLTNGYGRWFRMPFTPNGAESLTPFAKRDEGPADFSDIKDKNSRRVGKFTHPSGAPDNHLLTVYSPGPVNHQYTFLPQLDGGIYLIKNGQPITEPAQMLLIKNDPNFNEQWPRAVVPYERIYGVRQPRHVPPLANDGSRSVHLPEGTPFGLVGTSSLYKRESYPNGVVPPGKVTATYAGGNDPYRGLDRTTSHGGMPLNLSNQGGDVGLYANDDIHAIRIIIQEPTTDRGGRFKEGRLFYNHAMERLRILGEIPVRHFQRDNQPIDPDGNPDTSFLARIPADTAFTFQTLDKNGMVLNMAQTWHQLRPGEIRNNCGGCHAHSQKPTPFEQTAAARKDYAVWDLVNQTPLLTTRDLDQSGRQWDEKNETGLVFAKTIKNLEYFRDIQPILRRSCAPCHTSRQGRRPAGNLDLDADHEWLPAHDLPGKVPGTYYRLALDNAAKFCYPPAGWKSWDYPQATRYIRKLQSRRSLLIWKIFGRRLDGFDNEDLPSEPSPGAGTLVWKGAAVDLDKNKHLQDIDFDGKIMPPADAVAGTYKASDGRTIKVAPLGPEDRLTLVRWIDLGCPIDLDYDSRHPQERGYGWMCDDNRPVLTLTYPAPGPNDRLDRILLGMFDYDSGLDTTSFRVVAGFPVDGVAAGTDLSKRFQSKTQGVWQLRLARPIEALEHGLISVQVRDRQGNVNRIERMFSVGRKKSRPN